MVQFQIMIAGQTVSVSALFESTRHYCGAYLTDLPAQFTVTVTKDALAREQQLLYEEALEEHLRPRVFPEPFLERSHIQRTVADHLLSQDILMFHGSAVALDGEGYLFTAKCGTGKSTHTRLWRQVFGERAVMVNDDKPFLRFAPDQVLVCGAPWSGKHGLDTNIAVPLKGICILERGIENLILPASPERARFLFSQSHRPQDPGLQPLSHRLTEALIDRVPLWHMACNKEPAAAEMAFRAMSQR